VKVDRSTLGNTNPFPIDTVALFIEFEEASMKAELLEAETFVPVILT
jgi:hypothetical protein